MFNMIIFLTAIVGLSSGSACFKTNLKKENGAKIGQTNYQSDEDCINRCLAKAECAAINRGPLTWEVTECYFIRAGQNEISAQDCTTLNSTWLNVVTVPELPVPDKDEVEFKCVKQHVNRGGRTGVCRGGEISATQAPPLCRKISKYFLPTY
ncbi:hypothetical protein ACHWQZ_G008863 [Mnemiopsis leidyi]